MQRLAKIKQPTLDEITSFLPGMVYRCLNDKNWTMKYVSNGCEGLTGYKPEDFINNSPPYNEIIHKDDKPKVWKIIQEALKEDKQFEIFYRIKDLNGREKFVWERGGSTGISKEKVVLLQGFITDVTEIHQMKEEIELSHDKLRLLSNRLQSIREEEKAAIARDIHDELGQSLTALKLDLSNLEKGNNPEVLHEKLETVRDTIDFTIKSVQRIAAELRPPILDAFGLFEAIFWQATQYRKRFGIDFDLDGLQEDIHLSKDLEIMLFRVFQECLTNVIRHSKAKKVWVKFQQKKEDIILEIQDNGIGIKTAKINDPQSLGLLGIKERVNMQEGNLLIKGTPNKGTTITASIPIKHK